MYIDEADHGPVVAESARRHGVDESDIVHAYNHPIRMWEMDEGMLMIIGGDSAGRLREVGVIRGADGTDVVVHAMPARDRFLPRG